MKPAADNKPPELVAEASLNKPLSAQLKIPFWKEVVFSGVVVCGFFLLSELVLLLCGVQPILYNEDPYVGFSSLIPLFEEETGPDGNAYLVTAKNRLRFFNLQRFAKAKPAGTYRVFCMGGSTTYGHPYNDTTSFCGWMRALLPDADPSRQWQVINAGGISYASYRVALLMEELIRYRPDLFIIYSGHNEFLEKRTYGRIIETPPAIRAVGAVVGRTRIYSALKKIVDRLSGQHLRKAGEGNPLPGEVETILEKNEAIGTEPYHRDDEFQKQVLDHYHYNLTRMIDIAASVGARVILVTPASNLRHCSPFKSEHRNGLSEADLRDWQSLFDRARKANAAGKWDEGLEAVDRAARIDDRYAHIHYLRGQVLWELKRYDAAKASFLRARDEDVCPLRALTRTQDFVTKVAADRGVPLVDFVALAERQSEHGTPGEDQFLDHLHPTIEGNRLLALALIQTMSDQGIVHATSTWNQASIQRVTKKVERQLDSNSHGIALRNVAATFGWAGKFEEARKAALRATQLAPADAEAFYQVGVNARKVGRVDEAISYYRQALQINPNHVEAHSHLGNVLALAEQGKFDEAIYHYRLALQLKPDYAEVYNDLGNALSALGQYEDALRHYRQAFQLKPDDASVHHYNLGFALQSQGKLEEAINQYRVALQLKPNHAKAHANLASVLLAQGKFDEAITHCRQALQLRPDYAEVHNNLGNALSGQGSLGEAIRHYRLALELRPQYPEAHYNLANELSAEGNLDEAISHYRQALQFKLDYAEAHNNLGLALTMIGRLDEAFQHFQKARQLKPDWPAPLTAIAQILAVHPNPKRRNAGQAIKFAEQASRMTEYRSAPILSTLASAYAAAGQFDRAVTTAQTALELASVSHAEGLANQIRQRLELYQRQAKH